MIATDVKPHSIELIDVCKAFPSPADGRPMPAVDKVSLTVPADQNGEFIVLLGPSGCGKSTVLHMVSGLLSPDAGTIKAFGKLVDGPDPQSVTVPQAYTCFPWLTVLGNVEFGLTIQGKPADVRRKAAIDYLKRVGLGDRLDAYPHQLSGGMQQRVAIARTLAMEPPIVLMDEPFGALDAQTRAEMQEMLVSLWTEEKNLVLFVTHDISEALLLADRVLVFSARPARIVHDLRVPFPRPRTPELLYDRRFAELSQALFESLKQERADKTPNQKDHSATETTTLDAH